MGGRFFYLRKGRVGDGNSLWMRLPRRGPGTNARREAGLDFGLIDERR